MINRAQKQTFGLTMLLQFPTTLLLYGEPFFVRERFGWDVGKTALSQVMVGFSVAVGSYVGGQIAHRKSPRFATLLGLSLAMICVFLGAVAGSNEAIFLMALGGFAFSQSLVWPGLESLLVEGEPLGRVAHIVAYYNLIWSFGTACSFFLATPIMARFGLGAVFWGPLCFYCASLPVAYFFLKPEQSAVPETTAERMVEQHLLDELKRHTPQERKAFRQLGWLANPLGYVAINVVVTFSPLIQSRLGLRFAEASVWCSLWFYMRTLSFEALRRWSWWHYRWGFLCAVMFVAMISFVGITLAPTLPLLLMAQCVFGFCLGLIYQSSLFYSMAESDSAGENGGWHECFIGVGSMTGNLIVYGSTRFFPSIPQLSVYSVIGLLSVGLISLLSIGLRIRGIQRATLLS